MSFENDYIDYIDNYSSIALFALDKGYSLEYARSVIARGKINFYSSNPEKRNFTRNFQQHEGLSLLQRIEMSKRLNRLLLKEHSA